MEVIAIKKRGELIDATFRGSIVVTDTSGKIIQSFGNPHHITYMRSASKPFQAMALVETGAFDRYGLDLRHLAIASGSHNGQLIHTEIVQDMLSRAGLKEENLCCGTHSPISEAAKKELSGKILTQINHNCSGKHAAMLLVCKHKGWEIREYANSNHPVQKLVLDIISKMLNLTEHDVVIGIDGCSLPVYGLPIVNMALGFARLSKPVLAPDILKRSTILINSSIREYPLLVAGEDRIDTYLLLENPDMVCKSGAEGVHCMGRDGFGLAFKIEAGDINEVLNLGVANCVSYVKGYTGEKLSKYIKQPIKTHRNETIGCLEWVAGCFS